VRTSDGRWSSSRGELRRGDTAGKLRGSGNGAAVLLPLRLRWRERGGGGEANGQEERSEARAAGFGKPRGAAGTTGAPGASKSCTSAVTRWLGSALVKRVRARRCGRAEGTGRLAELGRQRDVSPFKKRNSFFFFFLSKQSPNSIFEQEKFIF
jgi:hypothetical protein